MRNIKNHKSEMERAVDIVTDAGGRIVGRTKFQKIGFLLEAAGLGTGFEFEYKHYGPYSESLASAARSAALLDLMDEEENETSWGGTYSIYISHRKPSDTNDARRNLVNLAAEANSVELELAATAVFLSSEGFSDAWAETARRKPRKATAERLARAKALYSDLRAIITPVALPQI